MPDNKEALPSPAENAETRTQGMSAEPEFLRPGFEKLAKPRHFNLARPQEGAYVDSETEFLWQFYCDGYTRASAEPPDRSCPSCHGEMEPCVNVRVRDGEVSPHGWLCAKCQITVPLEKGEARCRAI